MAIPSITLLYAISFERLLQHSRPNHHAVDLPNRLKSLKFQSIFVRLAAMAAWEGDNCTYLHCSNEVEHMCVTSAPLPSVRLHFHFHPNNPMGIPVSIRTVDSNPIIPSSRCELDHRMGTTAENNQTSIGTCTRSDGMTADYSNSGLRQFQNPNSG